MKINNLLSKLEKPALYEKGTHLMWSDPWISEQLQETHLDPELDLATRKESSIKRTIDWILSQSKSAPGSERKSILELGCGPGLYTERLAAMGHSVAGVDISRRSLRTARERAEKKGLSIEYRQSSYLELDPETDNYDLIYLIYTDICVLNPGEMALLVKWVHKALKPGGLFLFDVNNAIRMEEKVGSRNWDVSEKGFWSDSPYLSLSDSIPYLEDKTILEQHLVITDAETRIYRFWMRFFDRESLTDLLTPLGFEGLVFFDDILEEGGLWNGDNILFCRAAKERS